MCISCLPKLEKRSLVGPSKVELIDMEMILVSSYIWLLFVHQAVDTFPWLLVFKLFTKVICRFLNR